MKPFGLWAGIVVCVVVAVVGVTSFVPVPFAAETKHEVTLGMSRSLVLYDPFEVVEIKSDYPFELVHEGEVYPSISGETVVRGGRLEAGIWELSRGSKVRMVLSSDEPQELVLRLKSDYVLPFGLIVLLALVLGGAASVAIANDL